MPPINQQGSRAGLITGLVVFTILFVTASIFAFNYYGKYQTATANYAAYKLSYKDILSEGALQSPPVAALQAAKAEVPAKFNITAGDSALDVAIKQRDGLAMAIKGGTGEISPSVVAEEATNTLKEAQKTLDSAGVKITLPTNGLAPAISSLTKAIQQNQATINQLTNDLHAAQAARDAAVADTARVDKTRGDDLDKARKDAADDLAKANAALDANKAVLASMQADQAAQTKASSDAAQAAATDLANANQQVTKAGQQIVKLETRLGKRRADVINPIIRQSDGKVVRILGSGVCYINLGYGDQVTPGLTFEVYSRAEGVPPIPTNDTGDEQLPVGKASIEITHVGATSSECRIVKTAPGAVITEGDVIANLVYDPHTKYNFYVFGNFDLAGSGRPNTADTEVIKRLITQWGGQLQASDKPTDNPDVDTDFVVLGAEPVLPTFSKDDLTAENQDKLAKAQAAADRYQEVRQYAKDLNIPVLNQNRFLYYVGFYDQATR